MGNIDKIGLWHVRAGRVLLCRKNRDTSQLILPGGRLEPGESPLECLRREIREELGPLDLLEPVFLGTYHDQAAFDDPTIRRALKIDLYGGSLSGNPKPCSEIIELVWFGENSDPRGLTPIIKNKILPDLVRRGIVFWPAWLERNNENS